MEFLKKRHARLTCKESMKKIARIKKRMLSSNNLPDDDGFVGGHIRSLLQATQQLRLTPRHRHRSTYNEAIEMNENSAQISLQVPVAIANKPTRHDMTTFTPQELEIAVFIINIVPERTKEGRTSTG